MGDNYDRYRVRLAEIYESCRIIEQALDGLPEGPHITDDRKVALPPRHELGTSMEALIHHFKLVTEGFRVPPGEVYYPIESPRGELGCFVRADGSVRWEPLERFVLNQDTGGAIRGPGRVDFFWGRGEQAELAAGVMRQPGSLYFLVPKAGR